MKHYIIVKFIEGYDYKKELDNISKLFYKTKEITGVEDVFVHQSNSSRENRYDLMIEMILTDEGLINYDKSDIHKEWKELYTQYMLKKTIFDCD